MEKIIIMLCTTILLTGCGTNQNAKVETKKHDTPVSSYARQHLYELGDVIDSIEELAYTNAFRFHGELAEVEFEYEDYISSGNYERYKKKIKNDKQQKEFLKITKIRKKVMKYAKNIIDESDVNSVDLAQEFERNNKYDNYINSLYLKYSQ